MAIQTASGKWIDDDVANAILLLARLPDDQDVVPNVLIDIAKAVKQALGLLDMDMQ